MKINNNFLVLILSTFTVFSCFKEKNNPYDWTPELLHITIKKKGLNTLHEKRDQALERGILVTEDDSWVKGSIIKKDTTKVKIRLKGDWLDHLEGNKWSFRVKVRKGERWNRFSTFSLQDPKTRSYLKEWVLHQWFKKEGILTTRYDFINLKINDSIHSLYAFEEHFDKSILENNNMPIGPIMKFTEDGLWEIRAERLKAGLQKGKDYESLRYNPDIRAFKEKKILKSKKLSKHYEEAQNLMFSYMHGLRPLSEIFDLDVLAKYYAIIDLTRAHHGLFWHNQRFYYNPETKKLDPIGFDGYDDTGKSWLQFPFIGFNNALEIDENIVLFSNVFKDWEFVEKYINYLNIFSKKKYVENFFESIESSLNNRKNYIQKSFKNYQFDSEYIFENSKRIKLAIEPNSSILQSRKADTNTIAICNRHCTAVKIVGLSEKNNGQWTPLFKTVIVPCTKNTHLPDFSVKININKKDKYIVYKVLGKDSIYYSEINPWPIPEFLTGENFEQSNLGTKNNNYYYSEKDKKVIFFDSCVIKEPIIIPENHTVLILEETKINLIDSAFISSKSALNFLGGPETPIKIYSSDSNSKGIMIYETSEETKINYTLFNGFFCSNPLKFRRADFKITNSSFINFSSEKIISTKSSKFNIKNSVFNNSKKNGIYTLFSEGKIEKCKFNINKNCLEFNCSKINFYNSYIDNSDFIIAEKRNFNQIIPSVINVKNITSNKIENLYLTSEKTIFNIE